MFQDRQEAGRLLAQKLAQFKDKDTVLLGLTRGGVVVGHTIAQILDTPWDIIVVKKIGAPGQSELAIGAVGPEKVVFWDENLCQRLGVSKEYKSQELRVNSKEREERDNFFRQKRKPLSIFGKTVILVDDGIATGATTLAAIAWAKTKKPEKIILAVPVAPPEVIEKLKTEVDELVYLKVESEFWAVGQFYQNFDQVSEEEVVSLLEQKEDL